ncbi:putative transmembrane protein [Senna tora]|uniref:Putative transmembrane protein n=1 Tax=Senna tora TaxID=362788 RepID=A0A834XBJ2_9FABA|nr:putative transmembrane protein [Senna tora]
MAYYGRNRGSSVLEGFTLNPLPYPVLLFLAVLFLFLAISSYFSYEEAVESAEEQLGWVLFATPVAILVLVRWLSHVDASDWFVSFFGSPGERRRAHRGAAEGSSPWGVAALIVVLLVMVQYQSSFLERWFF